MHTPQPSQIASLMRATFFSSSNSAASYGQTEMHTRHPAQVSSSITAMIGSRWYSVSAKRAATLLAAAEAWATHSGMCFGPCDAPAR